jgi:hypothetical protein
MFKKIMFLIPAASLFSSFLAAEVQEVPEMRAPKALTLQIDEEEGVVNFLKQAESDDFVETASAWIHQISNIKENGYHIVLEDGSVWETRWWDHFTSRNWDLGDQIVLVWDLKQSFVKVKNLTKNNFIRALFHDHPKADAPGLKFIQSFKDNYSTAVLNDGSELHSAYANRFINWKEGQSVMTLYIKDGKVKSYALWNPTYDWIYFDLELLNKNS